MLVTQSLQVIGVKNSSINTSRRGAGFFSKATGFVEGYECARFSLPFSNKKNSNYELEDLSKVDGPPGESPRALLEEGAGHAFLGAVPEGPASRGVRPGNVFFFLGAASGSLPLP